MFCCRCCTKHDVNAVLRNAGCDAAFVGRLSGTECSDVRPTDARHTGHATASDDSVSASASFHAAPAAGYDDWTGRT